MRYEVVKAGTLENGPIAEALTLKWKVEEIEKRQRVLRGIAENSARHARIVFHPSARLGRLITDAHFRQLPVDLTVPLWLATIIELLGLDRRRHTKLF